MIDDEVAELYGAVLADPRNARVVAKLAVRLADSGARRQVSFRCADIASTGGPSSLSTLLCPLMLVVEGMSVAKLGVPGRPAGGIDVLGTIHGYRTRLSSGDFEAVVQRSGYAHIEADSIWAPSDAALFRFRQQNGTQAHPALATASLLAKKLAAGVGLAGLDARIGPHGNFGSDWREGKANAELYCETATLLNLRPIVFMTDATVPYQPFIGRGEALHALRLVTAGTSPISVSPATRDWLSRHVELCASMTRTLTAIQEPRGNSGEPVELAGNAYARTALAKVLDAHLGAQGADRGGWMSRISQAREDSQTEVYASGTGYVEYDMLAIRSLLLRLNDSSTFVSDNEVPGDGILHEGLTPYPDMAGATLMVPYGTYVDSGQPVLSIRDRLNRGLANTPNLFRMVSSPSPRDNQLIEVVK